MTPPFAVATCDAGICGAVCDIKRAACDGSAMDSDGCEVDTSTDLLHCGSCPNSCTGGANGTPVCNGGTCDLQCLPNYQHCGVMDCRPYNAANCHGCGLACSAVGLHSSSFNGCNGQHNCMYTCDPGWADCDNMVDGCERPVSSDPFNCGTCNLNCTLIGYNTCTNGTCTP
jgi:hypothetical protein